MTKKLSAFNRLLCGLLGILLIALGAWPLLTLWHVRPALWLAERIDHNWWATLTTAGWYKYAAVAGALALFVAGVLMISANLRQRKIGKVELAASDSRGKVSINLPALASAIGESLTEHPAVDKVTSRIATERGTDLWTFRVEANPAYGFNVVLRLLEETERDLRAALDGVRVETLYKVECSPVKKL